MVRATGTAAATKEDDLFKLAAEAGKEADQEDGILHERILQGSGPRVINEEGDPGFKTRVKPPDAKLKAEPKTTAKMPRGNSVEKTAADIAETLEEKFALIFGLLTNALPVTGTYGVENSPKAVRALIDIGKRRPAVMRALMKIADGADGMELGKFAMGLAVAVQVDLQKMQGDELIARTVGVTEIMEKYFLDPDMHGPNDSVMEQVTHARFQPI